MPAFDKNSVLVDFAYSINPTKDTEIEVQSCQRCGSLAPRMHRSVCLSCKRRIPPMPSRQSWDSPMKKVFAAEINEARDKHNNKECKFKFKNGSKWELLRDVRKYAVNAALLFIVVAGTPHVVQLIVGESGMAQIRNEIAYMLDGMPGHAQIASVAKPAQ